MKILVCLAPMVGHIHALLPIILQLIKQGCVIDIIIDESAQQLLKNFQGINQLFLHPTFMTEMLLSFKIESSKRNQQEAQDQAQLSKLYKLLLGLSVKAVPVIQNLNPQDYELVIMDDFAVYAIPFVTKYKIKHIVSQSAFVSKDMIVEIQKIVNPENVTAFEKLFGVDFQKQEFVLSLDYAEKVIVHSSKLFYEIPLNEKFIYVMDNQIVEYDQNKSLNKDKSIILISLGTVFNNNIELFNLLINYFENKNHQIIVTLGNNKPLYEQLQHQQKFNNIQIELWVDQKEILKIASLFITHSGYNGIKESIQSNTPMITIPQNADQPFISKRLEQLGVSLELKEYSNEQLDLVFNQIKDNYQGFQNKLKIVQESFKNTMNIEQFVEKHILNKNTN